MKEQYELPEPIEPETKFYETKQRPDATTDASLRPGDLQPYIQSCNDRRPVAMAQTRPTRDLRHCTGVGGAGGAGVLITGNVLIDRWHLERGGNIAIEGPPGQ